MQQLERVHLVQFFLFEAQTLELDATSAIIAPNGAGKSALLDALQIVLLGGDRSRIRFNAQAGGSARARTIRDYCLGTYRPGEGGRKRRTATTYISLVFRDSDSGETLTAGIGLGASADEPEHRIHGLYLLPGVALAREDHLERQGDAELPLAWTTFRQLASQRCKAAGGKAEFPPNAERFLRELLLRLRAAPTAQPDLAAYRKAFQNALNLQRVEDVDLFVRTLVAEDRPTDIARFRGLLESFRLIKEKIEQVERRIGEAEAAEQQYGRIAAQAVRAASGRALAAEYRRDLLGEQVELAEQAREAATLALADARHRLATARGERQALEAELEQARARLQGSDGYGARAAYDELAGRDRAELAQIGQELGRQVGFARDQLAGAQALDLPDLPADTLARASAPWRDWAAQLQATPAEAALPLAADTLHAQVRQALAAAAPVVAAVSAHAHQLHGALQQARERRDTARRNQARVQAGQAELRADVARLMNYLQDAGIAARPVCDLVRIADVAWQPAIEAYLRSHVEALLVPAAQEQQAVRLYRSLQGARAVYGVKLALSSHGERRGGRPEAGSVAALVEGDADAVAYLRRQLGELRCVDSEAELVRSRQGLTRDGLVAKGGGIERRRLPGPAELRIGAGDQRERARILHEELEEAGREVQRLEPLARRAEAARHGLAQLGDAEAVAGAMHALLLRHRQALSHLHALQAGQEEGQDPDLLRLGEQVRGLQESLAAVQQQVETGVGDEREAAGALARGEQLLEGLRAEQDKVARQAVAAFADPEVDANRVERLREELDAKLPTLEERAQRCEERARDADAQLSRLLPEAWGALAQYARDHGLAPDFDAADWRAARALLHEDLQRLRDTELVQHRAEAEQAYATAVDTFRSGVASALYDNFVRLKQQIATLNRTLRASPAFSNNERYQFHYEVVPEYQALHRFIQRAADLGGEDTLFGSAGQVPPAFRELVEDSASAGGLAASPLDDYRRFFRFEVQIRQEDRVIGSLSDRMRSGSGGEHRAPLYVIAGAALAAAYGKSEAHPGGLGLILLDEFGDKIDAQNARAITGYLRSLGLQLVLAAPDTAQGTLSGVLDSYIELFRDGDLLQVERIEVKPAARELLLSDQFDLHPQLLEAEAARIRREQPVS